MKYLAIFIVSIPSILFAQEPIKQVEGVSEFQHQIPLNPNKVDTQGRKTGKWTILFDENWNVTDSIVNTHFYRLIDYKEGRSVGKMGDYYRNGQIQMRATIISENPETYDGEVILYNENGNITGLRYYNNGHFDYNETILRLERIVKYQSKKAKSNGENEPPLFVRSSFENNITFNDDLRLSEQVDDLLKDHRGTRGEKHNLIFIDATRFVDAYSLKGRYTESRDGYDVEVRLFRGDIIVSKFEVSATPDKLAKMIVSMLQKEI